MLSASVLHCEERVNREDDAAALCDNSLFERRCEVAETAMREFVVAARKDEPDGAASVASAVGPSLTLLLDMMRKI